MKDEIAEKLRGNNFLSAMADGGTDQGVMEEVLVYVHYLDMELGKPVNEYLAIQEPKSGSSVDVLDATSFAISKQYGNGGQ